MASYRLPALGGILALLVMAALLAGCYDFKIDTVPKWCDQIGGAKIESKHRPSWAIIFSVSTDADAIRNDFVAIMNRAHMEKAQNRSPRMAWREGPIFHLINLATLIEMDPQEIIDKWRDGIEKAKTSSHKEKTDACFYGTVVSLFDAMKIHTIEIDMFGKEKGDQVTTIETERAARAEKANIKPL